MTNEKPRNHFFKIAGFVLVAALIVFGLSWSCVTFGVQQVGNNSSVVYILVIGLTYLVAFTVTSITMLYKDNTADISIQSMWEISLAILEGQIQEQRKRLKIINEIKENERAEETRKIRGFPK